MTHWAPAERAGRNSRAGRPRKSNLNFHEIAHAEAAKASADTGCRDIRPRSVAFPMLWAREKYGSGRLSLVRKGPEHEHIQFQWVRSRSTRGAENEHPRQTHRSFCSHRLASTTAGVGLLTSRLGLGHPRAESKARSDRRQNAEMEGNKNGEGWTRAVLLSESGDNMPTCGTPRLPLKAEATQTKEASPLHHASRSMARMVTNKSSGLRVQLVLLCRQSFPPPFCLMGQRQRTIATARLSAGVLDTWLDQKDGCSHTRSQTERKPSFERGSEPPGWRPVPTRAMASVLPSGMSVQNHGTQPTPPKHNALPRDRQIVATPRAIPECGKCTGIAVLRMHEKGHAATAKP